MLCLFGPLVSCHAEKGETVWINLKQSISRLLINLSISRVVATKGDNEAKKICFYEYN